MGLGVGNEEAAEMGLQSPSEGHRGETAAASTATIHVHTISTLSSGVHQRLWKAGPGMASFSLPAGHPAGEGSPNADATRWPHALCSRGKVLPVLAAAGPQLFSSLQVQLGVAPLCSTGTSHVHAFLVALCTGHK